MPENSDKPYAYDRCHELGLKPVPQWEFTKSSFLDICADLDMLTKRIVTLETQLVALTGAKEAAKPAITT